MSSGSSAVACGGAGERVTACRSAPAISESFAALIPRLAAALIRGVAPYLVVELTSAPGFVMCFAGLALMQLHGLAVFTPQKKEEKEEQEQRFSAHDDTYVSNRICREHCPTQYPNVPDASQSLRVPDQVR